MAATSKLAPAPGPRGAPEFDAATLAAAAALALPVPVALQPVSIEAFVPPATPRRPTRRPTKAAPLTAARKAGTIAAMGSWGILRDGKLRYFSARHADELSTPFFIRGPSYAKCMVEDFSATSRLEDAGAGFLLNFDTKRAWIWDSCVAWTRDEYDAAFEVSDNEYNAYIASIGGPTDRFDEGLYEAARAARQPRLGTAHLAEAVLALDLYPEELVLAEVARAGTDEGAFFDALRSVALPDNYRGWTLTWVRNAAAARSQLDAS